MKCRVCSKELEVVCEKGCILHKDLKCNLSCVSESCIEHCSHFNCKRHNKDYTRKSIKNIYKEEKHTKTKHPTKESLYIENYTLRKTIEKQYKILYDCYNEKRKETDERILKLNSEINKMKSEIDIKTRNINSLINASRKSKSLIKAQIPIINNNKIRKINKRKI